MELQVEPSVLFLTGMAYTKTGVVTTSLELFPFAVKERVPLRTF